MRLLNGYPTITYLKEMLILVGYGVYGHYVVAGKAKEFGDSVGESTLELVLCLYSKMKFEFSRFVLIKREKK